MSPVPNEDATGGRFQWRELVVHAVLLLILLAILFPAVVFQGELTVPTDLMYKWPPWASHKPPDVEIPGNELTYDTIGAFSKYYLLVRQAFDRGEWPLWNHLEFTGIPLLANFQSTVFYPPRLAHQFMDVYVATTALVLLKLFLCGMTAYICARGLGLGVPGARFFSVAWMLSMYNLLWAYWPLPDESAWFPIVFLGVEWILRGRYRRGFFTMVLGATLLLLAGHPETAFTFGLGLGVYFLLRLALERRRGADLVRPIALTLGVWLVALVICSAQLLPFIEYLQNSFEVRERPGKSVGKYSLPVSALTALWVPRFYGMTSEANYWGFWNSNYVAYMYPGMAVWVSLCAWFTSRGWNKRRRHMLIAGVVPALAGVLLTTNLPIGNPIKALPLFNTLWNVYYMSFALFILPLLAAMAIEGWTSQRRSVRELKAYVAALAFVATPIVVYIISTRAVGDAGMHGYLRMQLVLCAGLGLLVAAVLAIQCFSHRPRLVGALVTLVIAADLLWAARGTHPTTPGERLFPETPLTNFLQQQPKPMRVKTAEIVDEDFVATIGGGLLAHYGIEQLTGYDGITPWRIWNFLGVRFFGGEENMAPVGATEFHIYREDGPRQPPEYLEHVETRDGIALYRHPEALHRAYLAGWLQVVDDELGVQLTVSREGFDPTKFAVTENPPPKPHPQTLADDLGSAEVAERSSQRVVVEARANYPCVLVLSDAYYPGWKVQVDGEPSEIFPVYTSFRGVVLQPGDHRVVFTYEPASFRIGFLISTLALVGAVLHGLWYIARRDF